jgi:hypothetical protein
MRDGSKDFLLALDRQVLSDSAEFWAKFLHHENATSKKYFVFQAISEECLPGFSLSFTFSRGMRKHSRENKAAGRDINLLLIGHSNNATEAGSGPSATELNFLPDVVDLQHVGRAFHLGIAGAEYNAVTRFQQAML